VLVAGIVVDEEFQSGTMCLRRISSRDCDGGCIDIRYVLLVDAGALRGSGGLFRVGMNKGFQTYVM
jgi:hypothetical protein